MTSTTKIATTGDEQHPDYQRYNSGYYKDYNCDTCGLRLSTLDVSETTCRLCRAAPQPEPDAGEEWQQHEYKASLVIANVKNGGEDYDIIACTRDAKLPAHTAARIVSDHARAALVPKLVAALTTAREYIITTAYLPVELESLKPELLTMIDEALALVKGRE